MGGSGKKKAKKKARSGSGGFLGLGVGPSLSDLWDESQKAVGGVARDFAGLGAMGGQVFTDLGQSLGHGLHGLVYGDEASIRARDKSFGKVADTAGAAAVGMYSSMFGTAGDVADLIPDVGGVDVGQSIRDFGTESIKLFAQKAAGGDAKFSQAAQEISQQYAPQSFGTRAKQRGYLSPLLEDIGNAALVGGLTEGAANAATAAKGGYLGRMLEAPRTDFTSGLAAAEGGKVAAGVAKAGEALRHPLRGAYINTVGQLAQGAQEGVLAHAVEPNPLMNEWRAKQGMPDATSGVVQKASPVKASRLAAIRKQFEGTDFAGLTPEDARAVATRLDEESALHKWLSDEKGVRFETVDGTQNPYLEAGPSGSSEYRAAMQADIADNNHLYVDKTGSFGEDTPPGLTPEQNDIRRGLHDYLGHQGTAAADFGTAGENLAYQNEAGFYSPEAQRAVAFDQQGPSAIMSETGAFPEQQRTGALPAEMANPNYLSGAAPWARAVTERLNPEGITTRILSKLDRLTSKNFVKAESRKMSILVEAARNRLMHDPAVTTSVEGARFLVENFKVRPEVANTIVHDALRDMLNGRDAIFSDMIAQDPTIAPFLEEAGYQIDKLPPEVRATITPEQEAAFGQLMDKAKGDWENLLNQRVSMLAESRHGMKGLEDVGAEEVRMTKAQKRTMADINGMRAQAERLRARAFKEAERNIREQGAQAESAVRWGARLQEHIQRGQKYAQDLYTSRTWKAKGFAGAKWEGAKGFAVDAITQHGGFTYNAYDGSFIIHAADAADAVLPDGVAGVPGEGFSVSVLPKSTFEIPYEEWVDHGDAYLELMKGFAPMLENRDYNVGGWLDQDTGNVHLDISQNRIDGKPIDRWDAMLMASARDQISVTDLASGTKEFPGPAGSPKISRQMMASSRLGRAARTRVARSLYEGASEQFPVFNADGTPSLNSDGSPVMQDRFPGVSTGSIDSQMGALDHTAWVAHVANPEKYPTVADVYRNMEFKWSEKPSVRAPKATLYQEALGRTLDTQFAEPLAQQLKKWGDRPGTDPTLDPLTSSMLGVDLAVPENGPVYAAKMEKLAETLSAQEGRTVRPYEVQATMEAFARQEVDRAAQAAVWPEKAAVPTDIGQALADQGMQPEELYQKWNRDVKGSFLSKDGKAITHFFQTANSTTLTHEQAHLMRTLIGEEDTYMIERSMGMKRGEKWTRGREEQFANWFTAWMASDKAPAGLEPIMQRLKSALGEEYTQFNRRFNSGRIDPLMNEMFTQFFSDAQVPDILDEVAVPGKQPNIQLVPGSNIPIMTGEELPGGPTAVGVPGRLTGKTPQEGYRMGVSAQRIADKATKAFDRAEYAKSRQAAAGAAVADLQRILAEERLPSQVQATALDARAARRMVTLQKALDQTPGSRWPREYMHIGQVMDSLHEQAAKSPELAQVAEDVAKTFPQVLERAKELGLDPTHIRDFSPQEVKNLMYNTIRVNGRDVAGTRQASLGVLAKEGTHARSIEALAAAMVEVHDELRNSELNTTIQTKVATPTQGMTHLPQGMEEWSPDKLARSVKPGEALSKGTQYIIPKEVGDLLRGMEKDYNHPIFKGLRFITNPWRALVLTMSPRWYVNNFVGNAIVATAEGVRLQDWLKAWASYKTKDAGGRFADVPAVQGHSMVSDLGEKQIVPTKSIKEAVQTREGVGAKFNAARKKAAHNFTRMNSTVDEFARAAVYHRTLRVGGTETEALVRAQEALVDYGNLSPFEQQVVRSVIPFYSWQKGILKIVAKMPVDHPLALGIMMNLGQVQADLMKDRFGGEMPLGYAGLVDVPGLGAINTRGMNPFMDSLSLTTPEGISNSINPYADILIRAAYGAPEGGFVEGRTMSSYGTAVPEVNPAKGLGDILLGIPQAQVAGLATGGARYGAAQTLEKFAGINTLTPADIKKIVERTKAAKAQIKANAPFPARKKKLPRSTTSSPL